MTVCKEPNNWAAEDCEAAWEIRCTPAEPGDARCYASPVPVPPGFFGDMHLKYFTACPVWSS